MSRDQRFDELVPLPCGRAARTVREAADYVLKPPKDEQDLAEWQAAVSALMVVAEHKGPSMFAHNRNGAGAGSKQAASSERKNKVWGRRPLKRDR